MREGFAAVPNWVVRDSKLSIYAVMVYVVLAAHQGPGGIYPSRLTIAREARCSVRKVADALNELEVAHLVDRVTRTSKSGRAANGYTLRPHGSLGSGETVEASHALTMEVEAPGAVGEGTSEHLTPLIEEEPLKKNAAATAAASKGSRMRPGWQPSPELLAWSVVHAPSVAALRESENFVDYWLAAPGSKGIKRDWNATWRTWMRRAHDRNVERGWKASEMADVGREEWMLR